MAREEEGRGRRLKAQERKWTKELMAGGWTAVPNVLLYGQQALGLDALDVNLILHLAAMWANGPDQPTPAKRSIAAALGVDPRTVQRRIAALEKKGLIRREARHDEAEGSRANAYHFDGLIAAALPLVRPPAVDGDKPEKPRKA